MVLWWSWYHQSRQMVPLWSGHCLDKYNNDGPGTICPRKWSHYGPVIVFINCPMVILVPYVHAFGRSMVLPLSSQMVLWWSRYHVQASGPTMLLSLSSQMVPWWSLYDLSRQVVPLWSCHCLHKW